MALLRSPLDPGTMGGDQGSAGFVLGMLVVTFGGHLRHQRPDRHPEHGPGEAGAAAQGPLPGPRARPRPGPGLEPADLHGAERADRGRRGPLADVDRRARRPRPGRDGGRDPRAGDDPTPGARRLPQRASYRISPDLPIANPDEARAIVITGVRGRGSRRRRGEVDPGPHGAPRSPPRAVPDRGGGPRARQCRHRAPGRRRRGAPPARRRPGGAGDRPDLPPVRTLGRLPGPARLRRRRAPRRRSPRAGRADVRRGGGARHGRYPGGSRAGRARPALPAAVTGDPARRPDRRAGRGPRLGEGRHGSRGRRRRRPRPRPAPTRPPGSEPWSWAGTAGDRRSCASSTSTWRPARRSSRSRRYRGSCTRRRASGACATSGRKAGWATPATVTCWTTWRSLRSTT